MEGMGQSLNKLGLEHKTDKASKGHDYLRYYERFFLKVRLEAISILEIGVLDGASLKVWRDYFPKATIIGADIIPHFELAEPRIRIEVVDQSNIEQLVCLATKYGPFDIIIEDGSHLWEHQITSLRTLFPFVRKGGLYIVEDLHTNYGELEATYRGAAALSCVEYLKKLVDLKVGDDQIDLAHVEDAFLRTYGRTISGITFLKRSCIIEKGGQRFEGLIPIRSPEQAGRIKIVAHIGGKGDVSFNDGCVPVGADSEGNIQGFSLSAKDNEGRITMLQYRVRDVAGKWSEWRTSPDYVGSRGMSLDLTGFAIRVADKIADKMKSRIILESFGLFRGLEEVVCASNGEDCAPPGELASLCGLQIILRSMPATSSSLV